MELSQFRISVMFSSCRNRADEAAPRCRQQHAPADPPLGCAQASTQSAMKKQATPTEQRVSAGPRFLIQLPASRTRHMIWLRRAMIRAWLRFVLHGLTGSQVCVQCGATSTPLWRNGPAGAKTLCNACGVKLQRNYNRERALRAMESEAAEQSLARPLHAHPQLRGGLRVWRLAFRITGHG